MLKTRREETGLPRGHALLDGLSSTDAVVRSDNETGMADMVDYICQKRNPAETTEQTTERKERDEAGSAERFHRPLLCQSRVRRADFRARFSRDVIPGDAFFPWVVRRASWIINRLRFRERS